MAVQRQDFDDEYREEQDDEEQIVLDLKPELRKRIRRAARSHKQTVKDYLGKIIEEVVPEEKDIDLEIASTVHPITLEKIEELRQLREEIFRENHGRFFEDSAEVVRRMREERSEYLEQILRDWDEWVTEEKSLQAKGSNSEAFFKELSELRERIFRESNGHVFEDSVEVIRREREEQSRQIEKRQYFL